MNNEDIPKIINKEKIETLLGIIELGIETESIERQQRIVEEVKKAILFYEDIMSDLNVEESKDWENKSEVEIIIHKLYMALKATEVYMKRDKNTSVKETDIAELINKDSPTPDQVAKTYAIMNQYGEQNVKE